MVTVEPGIALGILGADCAAVLFSDPNNGIIGAAHAGWQGAVAGVTDKVIARMCDLGADPEAIAAVIGPAIQQDSYEVGQNFKDSLVRTSNSDCERFFKLSQDKVYFDLPGYLVQRIKSCNVREVDCLPQDTYTMENEFFSFRRMCHRGGKRYGRQIGLICLSG